MSNIRRIPGVAGCILPALAAALWLGMALPSHAQVLELRPVQLQFSAAHAVQSFTLINRASQAATVQVRAFKWSQDEAGKDVLVPTQDLMISPPFVQLDSGGSQVLRVRYLGAQHDEESSYRLLIDQLPPPRADGGVRTALRLSMPAFVQSLKVPGPKVSWAWSPDGAGGGYVTVINQGLAHAMVSDIQVTDPAGQPVALPRSGSAYLLSGAKRRWRIAGSVQPGARPLPPLQVAVVP